MSHSQLVHLIPVHMPSMNRGRGRQEGLQACPQDSPARHTSKKGSRQNQIQTAWPCSSFTSGCCMPSGLAARAGGPDLFNKRAGRRCYSAESPALPTAETVMPAHFSAGHTAIWDLMDAMNIQPCRSNICSKPAGLQVAMERFHTFLWHGREMDMPGRTSMRSGHG